MRRAAATGLVLLAAATALAAAGVDMRGALARVPGIEFFGPDAEDPDSYRVDVVFDTARGIIPGQLVKVAGVRVGTVRDVKLTSGYRARFELQVDRRFSPFRSDATCSIQPEGLTAENFVQCDPGTPRGRPLQARDGHPPTVPVTRTSIPVNLNGLFDIWSLPTRERFRILVNELGLGMAARGDDVNAILRRSNPSLGLARRALGILDTQRENLAGIVDATDRVVAELARRRGRAQSFVEHAEHLTTRGARHRRSLAESIRRLPPLLRAAQPALQRADAFAVSGTPLLVDLRSAAPGLERTLAGFEPFSENSIPALRGLRPTLRSGRSVVRAARPVVAGLRRFTPDARPTAALVSELFTSLRDRGFVEGSLGLFYYLASATSRFDSISHVLPAHLILSDCATYARTPVAGCSARHGDERAGDARTPEMVLDYLLK